VDDTGGVVSRLADDPASQVETFDNAAWPKNPGRLSVLTPFYGDDPRPLLITLDALACGAGGGVELVVLDDGVKDPARTSEVQSLLRAFKTPARFIANACNEGRARGRNRLVAAARGRHLLLLDSDMAPESEDFLQRYLALAEADAALVFGGFSVERAPDAPETALHKRVQTMGECLPAALRAKDPLKYVYTSNLLVRRDVLQSEPFDEEFRGWGWEDVDWGMRAGQRYDVLQIDNPATHLGLDRAEALIAKYDQSVQNFSRLLGRHGEAVRRFPLHRWALRLKQVPARGRLRSLLKALAMTPAFPLGIRARALKVYRAALYADVV
jgi:glycosyltransferase involved in cell wall biosynthesis